MTGAHKRDRKRDGLASTWLAILGLTALLALAGCKDPNTSFDVDHCGDAGAPSEHDTAEVDGALRVATINMWGIPYVSKHIDARFAALATRLRADTTLDVVGLQEVWDTNAREFLLAALRDEYPHQIDFHGEHRSSGLALLSRRPFVGAARFRAFGATGKWWKPWNGEWFGGKGIGAVPIATTDGRSLWVAVTHLHSCYRAGAPLACDEDDEFAGFRRAQLVEVRDFVNELAGLEPAVILGDFNFTPTSTAFASLQRAGAATSFDPAWEPVAEPKAPATRIDHIWLRPGKAAAWATVTPAHVVYAEPVTLPERAAVPLSDHCAIAATAAPAPP